MDLKQYVTTVENWPKEGITFRDITTIMDHGPAYKYATDQIVEYAKELGAEIVVGPEARGFIIGCPVAYGLEYGKDTLTMHNDAIKPGQKVLICDDLLATGGTVEATVRLVEQLGGQVVGCAFLIELLELNGRDKLGDLNIKTLIQY